jgi:hypothetical protein
VVDSTYQVLDLTAWHGFCVLGPDQVEGGGIAMKLQRAVPMLAICIALGAVSSSARAAVFQLDSFAVTKNGNVVFLDTFSDGVPPPSAPNFSDGTPASYNVFGSPGPEAGGLLTLNTANGGLTANAVGSPRRTIRAALDTNTRNEAEFLGRGLKVDDTLKLGGLFNLGVPAGPRLNGYGIRFTDRPMQNNGLVGQVAELDVLFDPVTGQAKLRWAFQDFDNSSIITVGEIGLAPPLDADQILLEITRPDLGNNLFFASYRFLDNGVDIGSGSFATGISLFDGENFVRAEFIAFQSVPEPGVVWLLVPALLVGAGLARRRC